MDKNAIKKYAIWARRELVSRVSQKALQYGISEKETVDADADSVNGKLLTETEKKQRKALISQIKEKGFEQVMEEVAYTWFNRFSALRFMEVNGYLPTHVRVFTDEDNNFKPQIITDAIHLEMDGLNMDKVYEYKEADQTEELYKYLLITQCNALNKILPGMFQRIADYTELLFPDNLLREGSVIEQMIALIPEEDWKDAVQIIGWLYQYYNIEQNELVYDGTLSKSRIPKELVSAATTIYTPDWAVRYMVENSLGRLWLEGHPNDELKEGWKYYLDEVEQEADVQAQLAKIREEYKFIKPEEIRCIDPCMGSGHILVYMFDVLMQIYESYGYNQREAAKSIIENNLYGLDIDDRAAQLAYFAVMMKARQYDRRFFSRAVQPHVYAIRESNHLDKACVEYFENGDAKLKANMQTLMDDMYDAKEYGSILNVSQVDFDALFARFDEIQSDISMQKESALNELLPFVRVAKVMAQKYDVVVTNPPYLGSSRFSTKLDKYVKENYADVKSDLSIVMYRHAISGFSKRNGFIAFITTSSWMFLSSFEKLRSFLFKNCALESLVDFGTELFEGKVGHNPIVSWVSRKSNINVKMIGIRLVDYCYSRRDKKEPEFFNKKNYYYTKQENFSKIPGSPIAYWVSENFIDNFSKGRMSDLYFSGGRNKTHNNEEYLRLWWEIDNREKWQPYDKGGDFRRWYGNHEYVVDWSEEAKREYDSHGGLYNQEYANKEGICWTLITSAKTGFRIKLSSHHYDSGAPVIFNKEFQLDKYVLAFLNTNVAYYYLNLLNPTINMGNTYVLSLPLIRQSSNLINDMVQQNLTVSKTDWDSFETSWDFKIHPLIMCHLGVENEKGEDVGYIEDTYTEWEFDCNERFNQLKTNEEELNRIFIDIYGLQDELTPEVEDKDITVHRIYDSKEDVPESMKGSNYVLTKQDVIKSLISYAVGCMFGRYSLDVDGLAYAGGDWDATKYKTYPADKDNIIPICDDEYFPDDIVARFVKFIQTVYGSDTLEENLKFIADALGGKGTSREVIRNYFLNDFYADHCKIYQKRPIYWLFDSGKKNGFKALIYMHRYQPDILARMRTDYVHEQQARYRTAIENLQQRINGASTAERVKLNKQLIKLREQAEELRVYEEKIHHLADQMIRIDLDDGVKLNYEIFKDVLAKIK